MLFCILISSMASTALFPHGFSAFFSEFNSIICRWIMLKEMICSGHHFNIFNAIVKLISINMVNHLIPFKKTTNFLFSNKSMLKNISMIVGLRMFWHHNSSIPKRYCASTFPVICFFFFERSIKFIMACSRAKSSFVGFYSTWMRINFFPACKAFNENTNNLCHFLIVARKPFGSQIKC